MVEGAGGLLVPFNQTETVLDLIKQSGLPLILVARTTLGTINHTLLTLAVLKQHRIPVWGLVLVGEKDKANQAFLTAQVKNTVHLPILEKLTPAEFDKHKATAHKLVQRKTEQASG